MKDLLARVLFGRRPPEPSVPSGHGLTPQQEHGLQQLASLRSTIGSRMLVPQNVAPSSPPIVIHPDDMESLNNSMRH